MADEHPELTHPKIKVIVEDGSEMEIDTKFARVSGLIRSTWDDQDDKDEPITLPNVSRKILEKCVEFIQHHDEDPLPEIEKPLKTNKLSDVVPEWYGKYIEDMDIETLYETILAANYLNIRDLLELGSAQVAALMRGKTIQEIRDLFKIENDFTPEEEA